MPQINNLRMALPSQYFNLEEKLRTRLGLYFLAIESVEKYKKIEQWSVGITILTIVRKITSYKFEDKNHAIADEFRRFVLELNDVGEPTTFITCCRESLNLDETLSEFIAALEKVIIQSNFSKKNHNEIKSSDVFTSSGMLIREMNDIE